MRIIHRSEYQNKEKIITELLKTFRNGYKKLHKSYRHENFLEKCLSHRVTSNFISLPTIAYKHLSKEEIRKIEKRQIEEESKTQKIRISTLKSEFENNILTFKLTFNNNYDYEISPQNLKSSLQRSEKFSDK